MSKENGADENENRRVTPFGALKAVGVGKAFVIVAVILILLTGADRMRYMKEKRPIFARKSDISTREIYLGLGYTVEYFEGESPEWKWFYE